MFSLLNESSLLASSMSLVFSSKTSLFKNMILLFLLVIVLETLFFGTSVVDVIVVLPDPVEDIFTLTLSFKETFISSFKITTLSWKICLNFSKYDFLDSNNFLFFNNSDRTSSRVFLMYFGVFSI